MCVNLLANFMCNGVLVDGSLLDRVFKTGSSPTHLMFYKPARTESNFISDGVVDSLRYLTMHENFIKPYSDEHLLATLLTKAF